jgi:hypothetical protein
VAGGDGIDTLAFSGAITMADADFRQIEGIESIRLANGATNLTVRLLHMPSTACRSPSMAPP